MAPSCQHAICLCLHANQAFHEPHSLEVTVKSISTFSLSIMLGPVDQYGLCRTTAPGPLSGLAKCEIHPLSFKLSGCQVPEVFSAPFCCFICNRVYCHFCVAEIVIPCHYVHSVGEAHPFSVIIVMSLLHALFLLISRDRSKPNSPLSAKWVDRDYHRSRRYGPPLIVLSFSLCINVRGN